MTTSDRFLVIFLRILGIAALFALVAVCMPNSWMMVAHEWLGLGKMPDSPVVWYLARSLSAFYALLGAFCLFMSCDLERYRPLVRFFGLTQILLGAMLLGIDLSASMPWWWSAGEGPFGIAAGLLISFLAQSPGNDRIAAPPAR